MDVATLIDAMAPALTAAFGDTLLAVGLFGSRARGDARPDSDLDIYAVVRDLPADPFARATALARAQPRQVDYAVNLLARAPEEFEAEITPLHLDLAIDLRILFERSCYLSRRLAVIRDRIREAGLYRDERLLWRWRTPPPTADWSVDWQEVRI
jgi:predicted nucleotidyltransferase